MIGLAELVAGSIVELMNFPDSKKGRKRVSNRLNGRLSVLTSLKKLNLGEEIETDSGRACLRLISEDAEEHIFEPDFFLQVSNDLIKGTSEVLDAGIYRASRNQMKLFLRYEKITSMNDAENGALTLVSEDGSTSGGSITSVGGSVKIDSGVGTATSSGSVSLSSSDAGVAGVSGSRLVSISSGSSSAADEEEMSLTAGSSSAGVGGAASFSAGSSSLDAGGVLTLSKGDEDPEADKQTHITTTNCEGEIIQYYQSDRHPTNETLALIEADGKVVVKAPADGSCFPHAIRLGESLTRDHEAMLLLRDQVANHMIVHRDHYIKFYAADNDDDAPDFDTYIESLRSRHEWFDHLPIRATANLLNREIRIYHRGGIESLLPEAGVFDETTPRGSPLSVFYNGVNHYDAVLSEADALVFKRRNRIFHQYIERAPIDLNGGFDGSIYLECGFSVDVIQAVRMAFLIPENAAQEAIKAYQVNVLFKHHPDRNHLATKEDEGRTELNEALKPLMNGKYANRISLSDPSRTGMTTTHVMRYPPPKDSSFNDPSRPYSKVDHENGCVQWHLWKLAQHIVRDSGGIWNEELQRQVSTQSGIVDLISFCPYNKDKLDVERNALATEIGGKAMLHSIAMLVMTTHVMSSNMDGKKHIIVPASWEAHEVLFNNAPGGEFPRVVLHERVLHGEEYGWKLNGYKDDTLIRFSANAFAANRHIIDDLVPQTTRLTFMLRWKAGELTDQERDERTKYSRAAGEVGIKEMTERRERVNAGVGGKADIKSVNGQLNGLANARKGQADLRKAAKKGDEEAIEFVDKQQANNRRELAKTQTKIRKIVDDLIQQKRIKMDDGTIMYKKKSSSVYKPAETIRTVPESLFFGKDKSTNAVLREFMLIVYQSFHGFKTTKSYGMKYLDLKDDFKSWLKKN